MLDHYKTFVVFTPEDAAKMNDFTENNICELESAKRVMRRLASVKETGVQYIFRTAKS